METKKEQLETIHNSLVNGQRKQMKSQIDEYGLYDFFEDYKEYLLEMYDSIKTVFEYFSDAVISYHRIANK